MVDVSHMIARWRAGDERAAEALYNHFREPTYRLAYGMLGDGGDAEEVAQDALTYALVNIHRYDASRSAFNTWLHIITVSRCRDKRRRKVLPQFSLTQWLQRGRELTSAEPTPEQWTVSRQTEGQVWEAIQSLKPQLREAIILRYWAGHTYREMAAIIGCPLPTAQSRVRLAFAQLRAALAMTDQPLPAARQVE